MIFPVVYVLINHSRWTDLGDVPERAEVFPGYPMKMSSEKLARNTWLSIFFPPRSLMRKLHQKTDLRNWTLVRRVMTEQQTMYMRVNRQRGGFTVIRKAVPKIFAPLGTILFFRREIVTKKLIEIASEIAQTQVPEPYDGCRNC